MLLFALRRTALSFQIRSGASASSIRSIGVRYLSAAETTDEDKTAIQAEREARK
jgi:hypothetical protein